MIIEKVSSRQFAGVRDLSVEFGAGVNVVYGANESGKSTLVNLISRTLFQNARIDGRRDKGFRDAFFPGLKKGAAAAGDFIDGEVTLTDGAGRYVLTKEWGADARCTLSAPEGAVRSQDTVNERLRELLQYGEGVYAQLLLSPQRAADAALELLLDAADRSEARQEVADAVSMAFAESGGASLDAIEKAIDERIQAIEGKHWDGERNAPVRKAGRWKAGLGSILEAYYRLEDARDVLSELAGLEEGATGAARAYDSAARAAERAEAGREAFAAYSGALQARSDRARIIKRLEEDVRRYRTALDGWPELEMELAAARALNGEKSAARLKAKYERAESAARELAALRERLSQARRPTAEELSGAKKAQREITLLEGKLGGMNLRASLKLNAGYSAELRSIGTGREIEFDGGEAAVTEAVTLSVPGVMELQLSPADTDAAAVRAQLEEQRRRLRAVLEGYGASGVGELEDMAAEADAAARLAEAAEARLAMALDGEELDEVERAAAQLPESSRSERDVDADILALCKGADIGRFMAAREAALERNKAEYGSAELLRGKLDGTEAELERLRAEAGRAEDVPAEYLDVADPARRMEELRAAAEAARDAQVKALREKSAAETRLEDFRAGIDGDPGEALKEAEADFGEQKRLLAHWRHIAQVFEERRAALSGSPMRGLAERFERNIAAISGGRNTAELPDGSRLDISVYSGDSEMSFGKLSEGTKETVSLAFRLAVLDHLFPEGGGFIVLDDPCADMDEGRAARSCDLIRDCAGRHQVIFLTCREEYAALLGGRLLRLGE